VKATEFVNGIELRLADRDGGGYWVRVARTGRTLGYVRKARSRWEWFTSSNAFRGDGRPGFETDGSAADRVPGELAGAGRICTRRDACECLVDHLSACRAPVLGFGRHPDVVVRVGVDA
jgi:hypothetical protein